MAIQLPAEAVPTAVGVLIYSFLGLVGASLLVWLTWSYNEKLSYIACLCYFIIISVTASIIQQFHAYVLWRDVTEEQFRVKLKDPTNPELAIANGSHGMDLVLYYIQYYCYNVEALIVMFWAAKLAQSVYGLSEKPTLKRVLRILNNSGKVLAVIFPLITIPSLQSKSLQQHYVAFILLADLPLMLSLGIGVCLISSIVIRYVQSRRQLKQWTNEYNQNTTARTFDSNQKHVRRQGVHDRWLLVRFTIAFVFLSIFEITNTLFQLKAAANNRKDAGATQPDFSVDRAKSSIFLFMPGVTPGLMVFVIFGTTKSFRHHMYRTFVPKRWQKISEPNLSGPSSRGYTPGPNSSILLNKPLPTYGREAGRDESRMTPDNRANIRLYDMPSLHGKSSHSSSDEMPILPIMNPDRNVRVGAWR